MITAQSHFMVRLFGHYKKQHLPFSGGLLEQPNKYLQSMEVLDSAFARIETERMKRAQKDSR